MKKVAAAIILRKGKLLVTRRGPAENLAGYWEFPGGKLESDETPQECIIRELQEELGLSAIAKEIIAESVYTYPKGSIKLIAVICEVQQLNITLTVHDAYQLIDPKDLLDLNLAPADIPIAKKLGELYG